MVKILYLDASGDPGRFRGNRARGSDTKHFVLAGIVTEPKCAHECSRLTKKHIEAFFPDPKVRPKKIHYNSLVTKKWPWNTIDRKAFADGVFDIILNEDITIFSIVIDKEELWNKYVTPMKPYSLALEMMMERYQHYLERTDSIGLVVADRENKNLEKTLLQMFERFKETGTTFKKMDNILDTIFFAPSYTCPILQLTDFCAYAVFVHYERNHSNRFAQIYPKKFDKYGLKFFP